METVNAFGLACPKPLMMAKAKIDEARASFPCTLTTKSQ